jgi:hypothetical protein
LADANNYRCFGKLSIAPLPLARFMLAHQVGGGLEAVSARHEFALGLKKIDNAFRGEIVG